MRTRRAVDALVILWTAVPWAFLTWLGNVIACRRWSGIELTLSLAVSTVAASQGWRLVWRWSDRQHDLAGAVLLAAVPDPEPWQQNLHPVQVIKATHLSHCSRRWGVNARSSGWTRLGRDGWIDLTGMLGCMILAVHPRWFHR